MRHALLVALVAIGGLAACAERGSSADPARAARPNLLLVTFDTTRADRVGTHGAQGGPAGLTPNLDGLARTGVRFERAFTSAPLTLPAHASLFTGLHPAAHGVRDNGIFALPADVVTVAERLREQGYATAAFVASVVLAPQFGLDQGFAVYDGVPREATKGAAAAGVLEERRADAVTDAALAWLRAAPRPFFLWVHYFDPHYPYDPPEPWKTRFAGRAYDGEIAFADAQFGRLLQTLDELELRATTCIVATADHGEGLGDHDESTHGSFLWDTTVHVPLIVAGPGLPAGRVVTATARHVDVAPTLLAWAGAPALDGIAGEDLAPLIAGEGGEGGDEDARSAWFESEVPRLAFNLRGARGLAKEGWRLLDQGGLALYGPQDPPQERDLLDAEGDRADALREELVQHEVAARRDAARKSDDGARADMESLGYLSGSADAKVARNEWTPAELLELMRLRELGRTRMAQGRAGEAETAFRELIARCPDACAGHELLGSLLAAAAQAMNPQDPNRRTRFEEARRLLERALELEPRLRDAHFNLAVAARFLGDDATAKAALKATLALDPGYVRAQELLRRLEGAGR